MKIDVSKAFDTLSWEFLLVVLAQRGFGRRWRSWICGLLCSTSTSICVNGERSDPFFLASGVRQGDPLSPALFILAMDTIQAMLQWAAERGLLEDLGLNRHVPRASIFADDAVLFFKPSSGDLQVISAILQLFGEASGLRINLQKSTTTCIRCEEYKAQAVAEHFQCQRKGFPSCYLGLPLSIHRLR